MARPEPSIPELSRKGTEADVLDSTPSSPSKRLRGRFTSAQPEIGLGNVRRFPEVFLSHGSIRLRMGSHYFAGSFCLGLLNPGNGFDDLIEIILRSYSGNEHHPSIGLFQALMVRWLTEEGIGTFQLLILRGSCQARNTSDSC